MCTCDYCVLLYRVPHIAHYKEVSNNYWLCSLFLSGSKISKFVNIFSLESFLLYGIKYFHSNDIARVVVFVYESLHFC